MTNDVSSNHKAPFARTLLPAFLFMLVAVASFSLWAFGGKIFKSEISLYTGCAVVFLGLGGLALAPGSGFVGLQKIMKLCVAFAFGFILYAIIWSLAWFQFRNTFGEVIGSSLGLAAMLWMMKFILKKSFRDSFLATLAIVFLCHTIGYYTGELFNFALLGRGPIDLSSMIESKKTAATLSKLAWGVFYGLGLGTGLSLAVQRFRHT